MGHYFLDIQYDWIFIKYHIISYEEHANFIHNIMTNTLNTINKTLYNVSKRSCLFVYTEYILEIGQDFGYIVTTHANIWLSHTLRLQNFYKNAKYVIFYYTWSRLKLETSVYAPFCLLSDKSWAGRLVV